MRTTGLAAFAITAVAVVGLAGCGSGSSYNSSGSSGTSTGTSNGTDSSSIELSSTTLGNVVTDGSGRTLYMYTPDPQGTSVCEGSCLAAWPALKGQPDAGSGTKASLIGTIKRSDGSTQGTYGGHPLYYYVGDSAAKDVNGQGLQGIWWVLDAQGAPVEQAASSSSSSSSGGGGGY